MKKIIALLILSLLIVLPLLIADMAACAESYEVPLPGDVQAEAEGQVEAPPDDPVTPGEPLTWPYLATIVGASALALLIVQYTKAPLDYIWKIPTKLFVYLVCLVIMLVATALTSGLTVNNALLVIVNALIAAMAAYGEYEVIFAKRDAAKVRATKVIP